MEEEGLCTDRLVLGFERKKPVGIIKFIERGLKKYIHTRKRY